MEFKILEKKKNKLINVYKISMTFMENDADDFDDKEFIIPQDRFNSDPQYRSEVEKLVKHLQACIDLDKPGRGGIDDIEKLVKRYSKIDDWGRFCTTPLDGFCDDDQLEEFEEEYGIIEKNMSEHFGYDIPMDTYGNFWNSYRELQVLYYDESGDEFPVSIEN